MRLTGFDSRSSLAQSAWIAGRKLVAPSFHLRPSELAAFALDSGQRTWTLRFGRDGELSALVRSEGRTYAVSLGSRLGSASENGGVHLIDEASGSSRRIVPLTPGERIMGLDGQSTAELRAPYLFTYTFSESERSVPLRALHLAKESFEWSWSLPIASQEVSDGRNLPMPAVSADCVAIAYQVARRANGGGSETIVDLVDMEGKKVDQRILRGAFDHANRIELHGLGTALFILGRSPSSRGACLEILESSR
jgi:hypothetical protein